MGSEADLDALCDLLNDDDDFNDEPEVRGEPAEKPKAKGEPEKPKANGTAPKTSLQPESVAEKSETDALRKQMLEMQKQMQMLQEKLEKAEKKQPSPKALVESDFLTKDGATSSTR